MAEISPLHVPLSPVGRRKSSFFKASRKYLEDSPRMSSPKFGVPPETPRGDAKGTDRFADTGEQTPTLLSPTTSHDRFERRSNRTDRRGRHIPSSLRIKQQFEEIEKVEEPTEAPVLVIDNGSGVIKSGFGTDKRPLHLDAVVGRPKYVRAMTSARRYSKLIVGRTCTRLRGVLRLSYPSTAGVVDNWNALTNLWEYVYRDNGASPRRHPVLITENPLTPLKNRFRTAEIFFEHFHVPSMYFQLPQMLCLYASGRTTGMVLDSGDSLTSAVPICEGMYDPSTVCTSKLGGRDVTKYLSKLLRLAGFNLTTSAELQTVKHIKHKMCSTAFSLDKALDFKDLAQGLGYKLPDGRTVQLGLEKYQAPELILNPSIDGREEKGILELLTDAITKCKNEDRMSIISRIVLAGGATTTKHFEERLVYSIRKARRYSKVCITAPERRTENAWLGGAILTTLSFFKGMSISKADFMEHGSSILVRRRPRNGFHIDPV